jgi:hypothetical protein
VFEGNEEQRPNDDANHDEKHHLSPRGRISSLNLSHYRWGAGKRLVGEEDVNARWPSVSGLSVTLPPQAVLQRPDCRGRAALPSWAALAAL